ncbi:MAG: hypothetical protein CUN49_02340 [Candidatus Thermofonsia Clade 1 bacterium]|jgi:hypothetical protein|uniref:DUF2214 domain-containing protein n=1 Tax=Candidatus Thermofonsia Clade 1 bacterium TaxID=2364210 RepID=A0A2M8PHM7_9CHLR|nr:MAG: hypothetical protein CUN49_02340 [Candidatus Thermofonsia Clade 1 bacterium]RMF50935.1 MAG: hypothetical protein D6749_09265 [Chloroflexota bacterium]
MDALLEWLSQTALARWMQNAIWAFPIAEIVHIFGISVLVGAAALFDLRLLGVGRRAMSVTFAVRFLLRTARVGFVIAVSSGALLFLSNAADFVANRAFQVKMLLLAAALANVLIFHLGIYRSVARWDLNVPTPLAARLAALFSLAIWLAIIAAGRLIAYV